MRASIISLLLIMLLVGGNVLILKRGAHLQNELAALEAHLQEKLAALDAHLQKELAALKDQAGALRAELVAGSAPAPLTSSGGTDEPPPGTDIEPLRSMGEANETIEKLGSAPSARDLAACLQDLDSWLVPSADEASFDTLKLEIAARLREQVKTEVQALLKAALEAETGADALKHHDEAVRLLTLFPVSNDSAVKEEAYRLYSQLSEISERVAVIRRQRYNSWATEQIGKAIHGYNKGSSYWSPKKENAILMESLVDNLKEVDPHLLEPVVLELYRYVVELTKGSISEGEKIDLTKKLTDPTIHRKTLGDF